MASIAELAIRISADIKQFEDKIPAVKHTFDSLKPSIDRATEGSKMLLGGITAAAAGIVAFGLKSITMAGQLEQTQVAFTTMLGSAEQATTLMKDLQKFGAETPFEFPEIQQSAKSLLAFGVAAGDVTETLRRVGDIASGVGAPLGEIAELYGKAKTQGRLFAEDINQLTGRGIPIIKELASQFKVSESEVKTLVESGKIGFPQLELAFKNMTATGSQFGGMMDAQSKTLPGMWSNLMDNIGQSAVVVGQELIVAFDLKDKLAGVIGSLGEFSALLQSEGLQGALEKLFPPDLQAKLVLIAGAVAGALVPAFIALAAGIWATMAPLLPFMAAGAALASLAYLIYTNWEPITEFFQNTWSSITTWLTETWNSIVAATTGLWAGITKIINDAVGSIVEYVTNLKDEALRVFDKFKEGLELFAGIFKAIFRGDIENALEYFTDLISFVFGWDNPVTQGIVNFVYKVRDLFITLKTNIGEIWTSIAAALKGPANTIIGFANGIIGAYERMINSVAGAINRIPTFSIPSWVPGVGGKSFGLPEIPTANFPRIPLMDTGGLVQGPGLFAVGPGVREIVRYQGEANQTQPTIIYNQNAPVYGVLDFEQKVKSTIRDAIQGGAFRGVIATP